MSRTRDLSKPIPPRNQANQPSPLRSALPDSPASPPIRPQRSAARQPGIVVSNPISNPRQLSSQEPFPSPSLDHRYHPNHPISDPPPQQAPSRSIPSNNKLYQAINHRANQSSSRSPDLRNPFLEPNYRSRDDLDASKSTQPPDHLEAKRPSTASSSSSFENETKRDLLSAHDLKDAKRTHGARNVIEAFSTRVDKRSNQKLHSPPNPESRTIPSMLVDQSYPPTAGFGEIERVIQKIKLHWDVSGITGPSNEDDAIFSHSADPSVAFSAFGLALELLEGENPQPSNSAKRAKDLINKKGGLIPSLSSFLKAKQELEKALQLTIQANYRQFDASVNSYKLTKASVDSSHKKVTELKAKLMECKATLGNGTSASAFNSSVAGKGSELKVLQSRRELLGEMLKLIDTIDRLKQVPERLESLISSKNFLSATVLLERSLRVINKPELAEIGGLNDLRSYLVNQESAIFEILIEELHNHLYLKNYYCNTKWRAYQPGQVTLPVISSPNNQSATSPFDFHIEHNFTATHLSTAPSLRKNVASSDAPSSSISYLQNYLNDLMTQPQSNPLVEEADLFLELASSSTHPELPNYNSDRLSTSNSVSSAYQKSKKQAINPELDSFKYIESLIESFTVLGKLGRGLDTVLQRVPIEVYALVESTLNEVDERHENTKRVFQPSSTDRNSLKSSISMMLLFMTRSQGSVSVTSASETNDSRVNQRFSMFKLNNNEIRGLESVAHVLQDFFWTLYSKFDGTLQSFRVLHEVSSRISERKSFKEDGIKSDLVLFSLLEVWKPIQSELLALIHAYLTETNESQFSGTDGMQSSVSNKVSSTSSTRNAMASIAEVLKINISGSSSTNNLNVIWKDSRKQLFKFKDGAVKQSLKELNAHEANVYTALKVSVPGLVLDSKVLNPNPNGTVSLAAGMMIDDNSNARVNSTHRLLVQPDAFHVTYLFKPTLEFLKRAKEVLPSGVMIVSNNVPSHLSVPTPTAESTVIGSNLRDNWDDDAQMNLAQFGGFSGFLEEFVLHTFLPQLEERIVHVFEHSVNAPDAFHDNPPLQLTNHAQGVNPLSLHQKRISHVPVAKSLPAIVSLIECLGNLLHSSAFHQEKFGRLIISIVVQYYQKCHERFKEMVVRESAENTITVDESNPHANLKLAANWAQKADVIKVIQELKTLSPDNIIFRRVLKKLYKLELHYMSTQPPLTAADLIQSPKKVAALAHLYTTLLSFLLFIRRLASTIKPIPDQESEASQDFANLETEWVKEFGPSVAAGVKPSFRMPLTHGLMQRFQLVSQSFSRLAQTILFTILLELRLEAYYYIDQAFSHGKYYLNRSDPTEPDLKIIELNILLKNYSENSIKNKLKMNLLEKKIIFLGLTNLLNDLMISNVKKLKNVNEIGFKKLIKNSVALQQNSKSILLNLDLSPSHQSNQSNSNDKTQAFDSSFEKCIKFYQIASNGPQAVMASIRRGENYTFEEYKKLLELLCLSESNNDDEYDKIRSSLPTNLAEQMSKNRHQSNDSNFLRFSDIGLNQNIHHDQQSQSLEKRKRIYNEFLIELHALALEEDDEEDYNYQGHDIDNNLEGNNVAGGGGGNIGKDQNIENYHGIPSIPS